MHSDSVTKNILIDSLSEKLLKVKYLKNFNIHNQVKTDRWELQTVPPVIHLLMCLWYL